MNWKYNIRRKTVLWALTAVLGQPVIAQEADTSATEQEVNVAFRRVKAGGIVGAITKVDAVDVNNKDNTIWTNNVLNGRALGMLGATNIRGLGININTSDVTGTGTESGNALFIVDGLPRDVENIRLSEIESITVLKDVNAAVLYGSAAINGVVLMTTKRGQSDGRQHANFALNYGVSTPLELPKFLNSADYMRYYNQARLNDGLDEQYSPQTIENFRNGNRYRYPDNDYYGGDYLNNHKPYFDFLSEFSGGNENARYYANMGWNSVGSLIDFGDWSKARYNTFNVRGNVDLKVAEWITTQVDVAGYFAVDRGQRGTFWNGAANERPYEYAPLLPIDLIDPEDPVLQARKNDIGDQFLLGGTANYLTTAAGFGYSGGRNERVDRKYLFNNRINFDLRRITEGLSLHTNISFDYFLRYDQAINNQFAVYEPVWAEDEDRIVSLRQHGTDARPGSLDIGSRSFRRRFGFYGMLAYDRVFQQDHHVSANLIGFGSLFKEPGNLQTSFQGVKQAHLGMQVTYGFKEKYLVNFSGAYVNSVKLPEGNRLGFSPTLGLGWVLSKEDFMSTVNWVDWLKLRLTAGYINSDIPIGDFYYYDSRYATSGSYNWYEGTRSRSGVISSWPSNPNLGFVKRKEVNLGLEGRFFNNLLGVEANLFYDRYTDLIVRPATQYPSFYANFIPYENFGEDAYKGAELGIDVQRSFGNWRLFAGVNALYVTSERLTVDEVYNDAYQYRAGHPVDATFGLEALGFFRDQADIDNSPAQSFGTPKPGDIKYKDQNNDGIVDVNDEVYLRRWQAPLSGGLQLQVGYKNVGLYVLGAGQWGAKNFREGNYFWVDGNKKYSEVVRDSWTPETATTATYPRLSTQTNNNNFRRSSFWLYSNDFFQIRKIQLTYRFPDVFSRKLLMEGLNLFVDANDVYQFAKNRKIRETRIDNEPYYRTFSVGVKAQF